MNKKQFPFFYGWIIVALTFFTLSTFGIRISFGAYFTSWEDEFAVGRTVVALISTLGWISFAFFSPVMGKMIDRHGTRFVLTGSVLLIGATLLLSAVAGQYWQLVILLGVVASIGFAGTSTVTATSVAARWFVEKRGLVTGFITSGMAVGHLIIVPLTLFLIANYDWRLALLVLGLAMIFLLAPLCYFFVRTTPAEMGLQPYGYVNTEPLDTGDTEKTHIPGEEKINPLSVLKQRVFWQLTVPYFVCGFTDVGLIGSHFIPFTEGRGFALTVIALAISIIAVLNIVGTIGTGYLSDRVHRSRLLAAIYTIRGLTFILLLTAKTPLALFVFAIVYGATEMASIAPTSSLCVRLFHAHGIGTIFSFVAVSHHLGAAAGSFLAGLAFDITGSYTSIIIFSILILWASAVTVSRINDSRAQVSDISA